MGKKITHIQKGMEFPDDIQPIPDWDIALCVSLNFPGFYLLHELGPYPEFCWCEPEVIGYDEDQDIFLYRHRKIQ